ncbi:MAG TPA: hypothetical protein VNE63_23115 [Candidatus Acidoferrales bacterium]|nr:hypothetical protein [Candidatus Acidoferrales bacterium]
MQAIAAYLIFVLVVIAAVFLTICAGALSIALYEGTIWIRSRLSSTSRAGHGKSTPAAMLPS